MSEPHACAARYWEFGPKTADGLVEPDKVYPKRIKQMKDACTIRWRLFLMDFVAAHAHIMKGSPEAPVCV